MYILLIDFSLVRNQKNQYYFERNFKIWIVYWNNNMNQTRILIYLTLVLILYFSCVRKIQKQNDWLGSFIYINWFWSTKYFKICFYFILIGYYHNYYLWRNARYLQTR